MGRNDLPKIHKSSLKAAKLRIYEDLNERIKEHKQKAKRKSLCFEGCSDCCFDHYTIQAIEFDLILDELKKWDKDRLNDFIAKVEEYWKMFVKEHPQAKHLLSNTIPKKIEEINLSIEKTSFPCIFLDESSDLCQIYEARPFKCRIFGNTYYDAEGGAMGIACQRYGNILNDDNFQDLLCDATDIIDRNTDLAIINRKNLNKAIMNPEYPLIYHLYKHFIL